MVSRYHRGGWRYRFKRAGKSYEGYGPTQEACQLLEAQKILELGGPANSPFKLAAHSVLTSESPTLFTTLIKKYLLTHVRPTLVSETHIERSLTLLAKSWAQKELFEITVQDIRSWATNRLMTGVKGATVNRDLAYLSAFFTWAIDQGVTTLNPALPKLVKRFPEPWRAYQSLSEAQISQVLALAPSHEERAKVALLLLTGQRWGVIAYLRWEQVDTNARLLTYRSKGKDRVIPLSDQALSILHSLSPSSGHVFKSRNRNTTIRWWYSARKTIGMPKLRLHDLRVTFARSMADKGYDLITVKECLGHSTLTMTQRYIPPSLSQMRAAMGAMGLMVRGDNGCGAIVNPRRPGGGAPDAEDMGDL